MINPELDLPLATAAATPKRLNNMIKYYYTLNPRTLTNIVWRMMTTGALKNRLDL